MKILVLVVVLSMIIIYLLIKNKNEKLYYLDILTDSYTDEKMKKYLLEKNSESIQSNKEQLLIVTKILSHLQRKVEFNKNSIPRNPHEGIKVQDNTEILLQKFRYLKSLQMELSHTENKKDELDF